MKIKLAVLITLYSMHTAVAESDTLVRPATLSEVVYVESPTDTDRDGKADRLYVSIKRPVSDKKLSTLYHISPYAMGGNNGPMHDVDMDFLPQDEELAFFPSEIRTGLKKTFKSFGPATFVNASRYAEVRAHSLGTGKSTGCATVGDMNEALAAKAVIDWLNGKARAFYENGQEAKADWANGSVGMTGISYDGTLPIMVASTGVEGLKAIVPIAAISNWYDYYRANGLVVNPGGYIGEDADVLGYFIMRKGSCKSELQRITQTMGREHGDFTPFWQDRNYLPLVKNIKAATFIIHGQADWNVKQKHAIQLWEALEGVAPRRMFLHRGKHSATSSHGVPAKIQAWFDHFLEGDQNEIIKGSQVEVELEDGSLITQKEWPHENTEAQRFYLSSHGNLVQRTASEQQITIVDSGAAKKLESFIDKPNETNEGRLIFLSRPLGDSIIFSGTPKIHLKLAVLNRKAANITVAIVEYDKAGKGKIITRGWADPQNYREIEQGETLAPGRSYEFSFSLEPKQYRLSAGNRLGVVIASTDYDYTLRPKTGTKLEFSLGTRSYIELNLSSKP